MSLTHRQTMTSGVDQYWLGRSVTACLNQSEDLEVGLKLLVKLTWTETETWREVANSYMDNLNLFQTA